MGSRKIVLASASPRRKQLLEWAEVPFDIIVEPTDESYPPTLPVPEVPVHIARQKGLAVLKKANAIADPANTVVIAADTVVVLENTIIGKPPDRQHAIDILLRLSGKQHQVITGVVLFAHQKEIAFSCITSVWFHPLTAGQATFYVDKYQPYDKAGAYAIQEWIGVVGIEKIEGDFYNVMGLPVSRVVYELNNLEI